MIRICVILSFLFSFCQAQVSTISGKIVDSKTNEPLEGAAIGLYNHNECKSTLFADSDGRFVISVDSEIDEIRLTYIGKIQVYIQNVKLQYTSNIALGEITLEAGFSSDCYDTMATPTQRRDDRKETRIKRKRLLKGVDVTCGDGKGYTIRYDKETGIQQIDFQELAACL